MADGKGYLLSYQDLVATGNSNEYIIYFAVAIADPVNFRTVKATISVQFVFGTDTNTKIWTAIRDFATAEGINIPALSLFAPTYTAV